MAELLYAAVPLNILGFSDGVYASLETGYNDIEGLR
jgi:hypothetical protein